MWLEGVVIGRDQRSLDLRELFLAALLDESAVHEARGRFAEFCSAPVGQLMFSQGRRSLLRSTFAAPGAEIDFDVLEKEPDYLRVNPRVLAIPAMRVGRATRDSEFTTPDEIKKNAAYQELIIPSGLGQFSGVPLVNNSELTAGIALHRPWEGGAFSVSEAHVHELASQAISGVLALAEAMHERDVQNALEIFGPGAACCAIAIDCKPLTWTEAFENECRRLEVTLSRSVTLFANCGRDRDTFLRRIKLRSGKFSMSGRGRSKHYVICQIFPVPNVGFFGAPMADCLIL